MEFRLLGTFEVRSAGRPVRLGGARRAALLATLLLSANRNVTVEQLSEGVFPAPPRALGSNIRTIVAALRHALAEAGEEPARLVTEPVGYRFEVLPGELDVAAFESLIDDGEQARGRGDHEGAVRCFDAALQLWRGVPLQGLTYGPLLATEVDRLQERRLLTVQRWAQAALALGECQRVADELAHLVRAEPLREGLWEPLMLALYRSGRQAEALAAYQRVYRLLDEELGVAPGRALQQLHQRILAADSRLEAPRAQPVAVRASTLKHLPAAVSLFTGRGPELKQLDALLSERSGELSGTVVIALVAGMAGVGKTALAVHWAHQVADQFPDGQLYLDLRGHSPGPPLTAIAALAHLLHALGVPPKEIPMDRQRAAGMYRNLLADRKMLLVLDNAADPGQIRPLLPGMPGCVVVVTSRDNLSGLVARDGAHRLTLGVLDFDEAHTLLIRLLGKESVAAEPEAAAELVRRCAGLPLALRIAAAQIDAQPRPGIAAYNAQLDEADRLSAFDIDGDPHTAVRAAFGLSYGRLAPDARRLFRLLGLAPGPDVTAEAAAALAGAGVRETARVLDRLCAAHLAGQVAPGRYALHDLLRAYATERALEEDDAAERETGLGRLLAHYLAGAQAAVRVLYPQMVRLPSVGAGSGLPVPAFADAAQATAWLDTERPNLVAAIVHARANGNLPAAWQLADTLRGYFWLRMSTVDWHAAAQAGLQAAQAAGDVQAQAAGRLSLGALHWRQSRFPQAIEQFTQALDLARRAGWPQGEAAVLGNLGGVYRQEGSNLAAAADHLAQAIALNQRIGRAGGQATNHLSLGIVSRELGRLGEAAGHFRQARAMHREIGSPGQANALAALGEICHALGRFDEALDHLTAALAGLREVGARSNEAQTLAALAAVHRDAGRIAQAFELAHEAVDIARDIGNRRVEADALHVLATVHSRAGVARPAHENHTRALDLARDTGYRYLEIEARVGLAANHLREGGHERAAGEVGVALAVAREVGYRVLEGNALTVLAAVRLGEGRTGEAVETATQAVAVQRETGHRLGEARALLVLADATVQTGESQAAAQRHRRAARDLLDAMGLPG